MKFSRRNVLINKFNLFVFFLFIVLCLSISAETKIMPLGDSITYGTDSTGTVGYRRPLYLQLITAGYDVNFVGSLYDGESVDFDRDHEGHGGWHATGGSGGGISANIYSWLVSNPADIVLLHIGTNDISGNDESAQEVNDILMEIDDFENNYSNPVTVLVARIILRGDSKNPQTIAYNDAVESMVENRIAAGDDLILVDMENALTYPDDLDDTVHPNDTGYNKMADTWFSVLDEVLGGSVYNLEISSTSDDFLSSDDITCSYNLGDFNTAATAWYKTDTFLLPMMTLYLPMEGNEPNALLDFSGNGNNGTKNGNPVWQSSGGFDGHGCYYFDGGEHIYVGSVFPVEAYTKTAWVKYESGNASNNIISGQDDHAFWIHNNNGYRLAAGHNGNEGGSWDYVVDSISFPENVWTFVAVTYDNGVMRLYRNGSLVDSATSVPAIISSVEDVYIGGFSGSCCWFRGYIDDARIYNHALSPQQISAMYANGTGNQNIIVSQETSTGQQWQARVTPFTEEGTGNTKTSETITIQSAADGNGCPDGMIAYWYLDESISGTYLDSFNGHHAFCVGSCPAPYSDGKISGAQYFDGSSTGIDIADNDDFDFTSTDDWAIEFWMKKDVPIGGGGTNDNEVIVGRDESSTVHWWFGVRSNTGGKIHFQLPDQSGVSTWIEGPKVDNGRWHHIAAIYEGSVGKMTLYVDGEDVNSLSSFTTQSLASSSTLNVGWMDLSDGFHYEGLLDELAFYNRALTETEIKAHYYLARDYCGICDMPVRIMPLGDSITYDNYGGDPRLDPNERHSYRNYLWYLLEDDGYNVDFVGSVQAGQDIAPPFDIDNEGWPGWNDDQVAENIYNDRSDSNSGYNWLNQNPADVILLHIGTNNLEASAEDINDILKEIDQWEADHDHDVTVILAKIINRQNAGCGDGMTHTFNENVEAIATARIAAGDKIILVDIECGAGIDYNNISSGGDMMDTLHPANSGYEKMADIWYSKLSTFLLPCGSPLPVCPDEMISYWKLDETGSPTSFVDEMGLNDGVCAAGGCPIPATGQVGGCMSNSGSGGMGIDIPADTSFDWGTNDSFTIEYWMKQDGIPTENDVIIARDDPGSSLHWWIGVQKNTGYPAFQLVPTNGDGQFVAGTSNLSDNNWHHCVFIRNAATGYNRIYIDGVEDANVFKTYTAGFDSATAPITIGWITLDTKYTYTGLVDEVAVYDRALDNAEILWHYNNGLSGKGYCNSSSAEPNITSVPVTEAYVGVEYSYDVSAAGNPEPVYSLIDSPDGMDINSATGLISWMPQLAGDYNVVVEAGNTYGTDIQGFTISVNDLPPFALKINCGGDTVVDGNVAWESSAAYVTGGANYDFAFASVDTTTNSIAEPVPPLEVYNKCRHQSPHTYNFSHVPNGTYVVRIHWVDKFGPPTVRDIDYDIEGVRVQDDWDIYAEAGGTGIAIDKEYVVTVSDGNGMQITSSADDGDAFESAIEITSIAAGVEPNVISMPITTAFVGYEYSYDVNATGDPEPVYSLITAPNDMDINAVTGLITWMPIAIGDFNVVVEANNIYGTDVQVFTINVTEVPLCANDISHYWKLDESTSPYLDSFGTADITCTSCPAVAAGIVDTAQYFDGSSNEAQIPDDGTCDWNADDSFTIAFWMKTNQTSPPRNMVIIGRDGGPTNLHWWIGTEVSSGKIRFQLKDTGNQGIYLGDKGPELDDNQWHYVVCIRDENKNENRVYIDGALVDSGTHDYTSNFAESVPLNVGYIELPDRYYYDGALDELTIYDRAISEAEIIQQYTNGQAGKGACMNPEEPIIVSTPATSISVVAEYIYDINATAWPVCDYSLVSGPNTMDVNSITGVVTWIPTVAGDYNVVVAATNTAGMDTQAFTINVTDFSGPQITDLSLNSTSGNDWTTDDLICDYNLAGSATTAAVTWYKNALPQMLLYMPMEGGSTNALKDYSGNGNTPTNRGATWYSDQGYDGGGCFYFEDDTILAGEILPANSSYTMMAWVKRTGDDTLNIISGDGTNNSHAFWCACSPGDGLGGGHEGEDWCDVEQGQSFPSNQWHHVAISYDLGSNYLRLYMDGNEVDAGLADGPTDDQTVVIGGYGDSHEWRGYIDDVRVYGDAVSEAQIEAIYNSGFGAANIIVSDETEVGDTWQGYVTAFDDDEEGLTEASNMLTIQSSSEAPIIISAQLTHGFLNELYEYDVDATGNPIPVYSFIESPNDMDINSVSGLITWIPTAIGDYNVVIEANNIVGTDTQAFTITVTQCPSSIISYWMMDDNSVPPLIDSYNGYDGTVEAGSPEPNSNGIINGAIYFDGTDEIDVADSRNEFDWLNTDSFSIEFWVKTSDTECCSGNRVVIGRDDGSLHWWVGGSQNGHVAAFQLMDRTRTGQFIKGTTPINDNEWHHIVAVRQNADNLNRLYVDGVEEANAVYVYSQNFNSTAPLNIGYINLSPYYRYEGLIDEMAVYGRALTPAEVMEHYQDALLGDGYCSVDTDGDGYSDHRDNCPDNYNPDQNDMDADDIGDICDNCPNVSNPSQANSDSDNFGDLCDNCPNVDNPDQNDLDTDNVGDLCDNCPEVSNTNQANSDSDDFGDKCDNCPDIDNPTQQDTDLDGIGDECECWQANIDGIDPVDFIDFAVVVENWATSSAEADTNWDNIVDIVDLAQICEHWLEECN